MKNESVKSGLVFAVILAFFILSFSFSFILASEKLERASAVSVEEESRYSISEPELEMLYQKEKGTKIKKDILILGYHQVRDVLPEDTKKERLFITPVETFEKEMKFLKDSGYEAISLEEYMDYFYFRKFLKPGEKKVVITFDDGYISQFENAFPVLKKYNFKATFFIYSDCIDKFPACMSWDNLNVMKNYGMRFANHSLHHFYLPDLNINQIKKEIKDNEAILKEKVGEEYFSRFFAYPFGGSNEKIEKIVEDLGYVGGLGVFPGFYERKVRNLYIYRYLMGDSFLNFETLFK